MISTLSHERFATVDDNPNRETPPKSLKSRLGDRLDEIAVFALVAVTVTYIAAATFWFVW